MCSCPRRGRRRAGPSASTPSGSRRFSSGWATTAASASSRRASIAPPATSAAGSKRSGRRKRSRPPSRNRAGSKSCACALHRNRFAAFPGYCTGLMNDLIDFDVIDEHGPQTYRGTYDVSANELERVELESLGGAKIEVTVDKGDQPGEYVADGMSSFTADLVCSRCLEPYPFANTSTFHVRFS